MGEQNKIDERDVIFARFEYREGTEIYEEYYERRPEYKKIDYEIKEKELFDKITSERED